MKVCSFAIRGRAGYGLVQGAHVVDVSRRLSPACPTLRSALAAGVFDEASRMAGTAEGDYLLKDVTLLPPVTDPEKIICIGLNYKDHAAEGGAKVPVNPQLFARFANTLVGQDGELLHPKISDNFDYEGELAVIIGRGGRHISRADALQHVFGYACFMDGSVRDIQFKHSLVAGKNFPCTGGFGPWIVTADEIPDPHRMTLTTRLNGRQVQHKGLDDMIFDVPAVIAYISTWTELRPGDVISTGTPEGVGYARTPPLWMKAGDQVEVEISGIGVLRNNVAEEGR